MILHPLDCILEHPKALCECKSLWRRHRQGPGTNKSNPSTRRCLEEHRFEKQSFVCAHGAEASKAEQMALKASCWWQPGLLQGWLHTGVTLGWFSGFGAGCVSQLAVPWWCRALHNSLSLWKRRFLVAFPVGGGGCGFSPAAFGCEMTFASPKTQKNPNLEGDEAPLLRGIFKLQQHRAEAARGKRCPAGNCSLLSDPMVCLLAPVLFHVQPFSPQPSPAFQEPSLPQTPGTPITHTQNFCSAFAEEESTERLPWLCLEEESKTDKKKKKRDRNAK